MRLSPATTTRPSLVSGGLPSHPVTMPPAPTMTGINGFTVRALPIPEVQEILKRYNRLVPVD